MNFRCPAGGKPVCLAIMYARAFSTLGCAELSLDEVQALARRHRIPGIELRALGGTTDLPAWYAANFASPAALAEPQAASDCRVVALDTSWRLIDGTAADRDNMLALLPWARALGVRWLRVFDGGATLDDQTLTQAAEALAWWRRVRAERELEVDLMIETHDVLLDARRIQRFLAALPDGRAALLWDAHHTWRKGGEDPRDTWQAIRPHVVHVHVKDSVSRPSAHHPFTYVLPGVGEFPMAPLRETLAAEFSGTVSLEWERFWHPYLPPLDAALASARNWW